MVNRRAFLLGASAAIYAQDLPTPPKAVRFKENPIIRPDMPTVGDDINGPSLIAAPSWLTKPLGRYYLYFAGHRGTYIRLAYGDNLAGPWKIYEPGVLRLNETICRGHIASPDVHIDNAKQEIKMFFHGPVKDDTEQRSFLAMSKDGVHFKPGSVVLGESYFRVFQWGGYHYAISNGGKLHRSKDPAVKFEEGPQLFAPRPDGLVRHVAVKLDGDAMSIFYSRIGDSPESILFSAIRLTPDWTAWRVPEGSLILKPELQYEGVDLPLKRSKAGPAGERVRQLRDPAVYREGAKTYLLYSVAGESGIAISELHGS